MCVRPLRIKNPKLQNEINDKPYIYVPCGKCIECVNAQKKNWQIRLRAEFYNVRNHGGTTFMTTLTIDDDHMKYLDTPTGRYQLPSKDVCQKFIKRLREDTNHKFRYFLVSERGTNTQRVHYHMVIYFPYKVNTYTFYKQLKRNWQQGFVDISERRPVDSMAALGYVAKYACKSLEDRKFLKQFDDVDTKKKLANFKLVSKHFGECLITDETNKKLFSVDTSTGMCSFTNSNGTISHIPLPLYYQRKLYYDVTTNINGNNSYILNQNGINRNVNILDNRITLFKQTTEKIFDEVNSKDYYDLYGRVSPFTSQEIRKHLKYLGIYKYVFKDRFFLLNESELVTEYKQTYKHMLDGSCNSELFESDTNYVLYNYCPFFFQYDTILNVIDDYRLIYNYKRYVDESHAYNAEQYRRYITGKYKKYQPKEIMTFKQYLTSYNY